MAGEMKITDYGQKGFDNFLQYHTMIEPGMMLLKNGSYLVGFLYQGPDLESSTASDSEWLSGSFNNAIKRLDEGWMIHQIVVRALSSNYPIGYFSEPTNCLIDNERFLQFTEEGIHYETFPFLFLTYLPPMHAKGGAMKKLGDFLMGRTHDEEISYIERDVKYINDVVTNFQTSFSQNMRFRRLSHTPENDELLHSLNMIMNQKNHPCRLPDPPDNLDSWLSKDIENGESFVYDGKYAAVLSIDGLPPFSRPGLLAEVEHLPIDLVWSSRFIVTDQTYARAKIADERKKWRQKEYPFIAKMMNNTNAPPDQYAVQMVQECNAALAMIEQGSIIYGHYTSTIILKHEDDEILRRQTREAIKLFERLGFSIRLEHRNTLEAFLGSLPGHGRENIRKPFLHSLNFADLAPLTNYWSGAEFCPCPPPNYPPKSPPLLQAASVGTTPFRLNLHVDDVGHTLILGPTGSGKSTLLALLASQFERYENSQTFIFDKGFSMFALTAACHDAAHYDLGTLADKGGLCPLSELDTEEDRGWAYDYIDTLLELQLEDNKSDNMGAEDRNLVREAVNILANSTKESYERTMTAFISTVQSKKARNLMSYYQISNGPAGDFIDGKKNDIEYKSLVAFEIQELMNYGKNIVVPVLLFLFRQIEKRLTGRPSLLIIDEAWLALSTPIFARKIKEWLKVFRKANCAVILATQNVSDIANSDIANAVIESCPTKIFLPNPEARNEHSARLYREIFGLNKKQINLISNALRKSQYYLVNPMGRRLFELGLGPITLSFAGAGAKEDISAIKRLREEYGAVWPYYWLKERGLRHAAEAWLRGHEVNANMMEESA
jgi:type IV secretion system protein VirB4